MRANMKNEDDRNAIVAYLGTLSNEFENSGTRAVVGFILGADTGQPADPDVRNRPSGWCAGQRIG